MSYLYRLIARAASTNITRPQFHAGTPAAYRSKPVEKSLLSNVGKCAYVALLLLLASMPAHAQLIHNYDFTNGVTDLVGTANGSLAGGASVSGGSLQLNGTTALVQFAQHIVPTSGSYTVAFFARQNASQAGSYLEFISQGFSGGPGFYIGYDPTNGIRATDSWITTGVAAPTIGQWNHFALAVDSANNHSQLYVNGLLKATLSSSITTTLSGTDTRLGTQFSSIPEYFNGSLDDVRVYQNSLSGAEVATLAANRSGTVVPEAGTLALLSLALMPVGVGLARRRK